MNCEFCDRELHLSHYEGVGNSVAAYDCTNCPVLVSFYFIKPDFNRTKTVFWLDKHEKIYMWTNDYTTSTSRITAIDIDHIKKGSLGGDPCLIKFPKIMNINPDNIMERFGFYMVFL